MSDKNYLFEMFPDIEREIIEEIINHNNFNHSLELLIELNTTVPDNNSVQIQEIRNTSHSDFETISPSAPYLVTAVPVDENNSNRNIQSSNNYSNNNSIQSDLIEINSNTSSVITDQQNLSDPLIQPLQEIANPLLNQSSFFSENNHSDRNSVTNTPSRNFNELFTSVINKENNN